eukprot:888350-Rhodomonas_salina.1
MALPPYAEAWVLKRRMALPPNAVLTSVWRYQPGELGSYYLLTRTPVLKLGMALPAFDNRIYLLLASIDPLVVYFRPGIPLRRQYALPGTGLGQSAMPLRQYAMSGTDLAYGAPRPPPRLSLPPQLFFLLLLFLRALPRCSCHQPLGANTLLSDPRPSTSTWSS